MKRKQLNNYPELRLAAIIDSLKILIRDNNFEHLTSEYNSLIKKYNNLMQN